MDVIVSEYRPVVCSDVLDSDPIVADILDKPVVIKWFQFAVSHVALCHWSNSDLRVQILFQRSFVHSCGNLRTRANRAFVGIDVVAEPNNLTRDFSKLLAPHSPNCRGHATVAIKRWFRSTELSLKVLKSFAQIRGHIVRYCTDNLVNRACEPAFEGTLAGGKLRDRYA